MTTSWVQTGCRALLVALFVGIAACESEDLPAPAKTASSATSPTVAPLQFEAHENYAGQPEPQREAKAPATETTKIEDLPAASVEDSATTKKGGKRRPLARTAPRSVTKGSSAAPLARGAPDVPDALYPGREYSSGPRAARGAPRASKPADPKAAKEEAIRARQAAIQARKEALRARKEAQARAREEALARARAKDDARRSDDKRLPLIPRHDGDDRFAEIRVLGTGSMSEMTFHDYGVNPTISTDEEPVSTFAVDVDSASYGVARSYLQRRTMPEEAAIRVEEMINAFDYAYAAPDKEAFLVQAEAFPSPNRKGYHVLHIGVKGREVSMTERKPAGLVFVVDVSGSMEGEHRLGLVKRSLTMLTRQLDGRDSVALVTYGSDARVVLESTRTTENGKRQVIDALAGLATEGSTNVEAGLALGYEIAGRQVGAGSTARVILCSDGVANTGSTAPEAILARVKAQAERGVTISTVGFGMGHYNDVLMEQLADRGNGNYAYVDTIEAAQRVFVEQLGATIEVIAKDVKLQVAFDKGKVARYRLLGFENRMLDKRDFANDRVDAGEIGAGHTVTAIYEVKLRDAGASGELGVLRVRYKEPAAQSSRLIEKAMPMGIVRDSYVKASAPTKLSMVVAAFAEKLRGSYWARNESYDDILKLWDEIPESLRSRQDVTELRSLIVAARSLDTRGDRFETLLPIAKMDFDRVPVLY